MLTHMLMIAVFENPTSFMRDDNSTRVTTDSYPSTHRTIMPATCLAFMQMCLGSNSSQSGSVAHHPQRVENSKRLWSFAYSAHFAIFTKTLVISEQKIDNPAGSVNSNLVQNLKQARLFLVAPSFHT